MNRGAVEPPFLGVVIVHYGDPEPTHRCLDSLSKDPSPVHWAAVVVDNSGNYALRPNHGDLVGPPARPSIHVLPSEDNPGFGEGANRGVDFLRAEGSRALGWVILNGDVEIAPGFLAAVADHLGPIGRSRGAQARTTYQAVGGPIYLDRIGGALWFAGGHTRPFLGTVFQSRQVEDASRQRRVGFLTGAAIAVEATTWRAIGGFDPRFFLYNEDLDLCLRLRRLGASLGFLPGMKSLHRVGGATGSLDASPLYLEHLTRTRLLPYRSLMHRLYLAILHTGWVAVRALRFALAGGADNRRRVVALLRGHRDALRGVWRSPPPSIER